MLRWKCRFTILALAMLASAAPALAADRDGATREEAIDGVLHVFNPATPPDGDQTLRLTEAWRRGGEDDDLIFGLITQVRPDEEGNVYVLDSQLCQVRVFSPAGELVRTLFREGEGPGEVYDPRDVLLLPDGRVGVAVDFPGKVVTVNRDGTPAGTIMIHDEDSGKGFTSLNGVACGGGNVVFSGVHSKRVEGNPAQRDRINFVSSYDLDGKERINYHNQSCQYDFSNFVFAESSHLAPTWFNTAVSPDGKVYLAPDNERYRIEVYGRDGGLERIIERDFELYERTREEFDTFFAQVEGALAGAGIPVTIEINDFEACVHYIHRGIRIRPDGSLWVITSRGVRGLPEGILVRFDVFDAEGHFQRQVSLAGPGDATRDGIFFTEQGQIVVVRGYMDAVAAQFGRARELAEEEEDAMMELICYRIEE